MKILSFFLRASPRYMSIVILAGVVSGVSNIGLLALITATLTAPSPVSELVMWLFVVLCLIVPAAKIVSEVLLTTIGQQTIYELRMKMSRQILAAPLQELEQIGAPRLLATLTSDVLNIANSLTVVPSFCINFAIVVGCLVYLGWLSLTVLFVTLAFMVLGVASYHLPVSRAMRFMRRAREQEDALYKQFRALTDGNKELKLHQNRRHEFLTHLLRNTAQALSRENVKGLSLLSIAGSWGQILFFAIIGVLIFALPAATEISLRVQVGCALTILFLIGPLGTLLNVISSLGRANIALKKIEDLGLSLSRFTEQSSRAISNARYHFNRLQLKGVSHAYHREGEDHTFILGPLDLHIEAGELIFIIGGNGSGKTTLAKLLAGLYISETGEIRLDGQVITDANRNHYRQHFSVVFSDFFLFDNLLGLDDTKLDAQATEYLNQLQLQHKVAVKDRKLSTTDLSQGQRKRLALLTAYLEDRPIYLFDEWAADQDPVFKEVFYSQLLMDLKARGKTVLVITHDDRYYYLADRVLKLEDGKLTQDHEVRLTAVNRSA